MLYEIIRQDMIEEFIIYVNKTNYQFDSAINESIYETNYFLSKNKKTTLIEYSAFFGSTQIFKYLYLNGVNLTDNLWLYAIHGDNAEIIKILEENAIMPSDIETCLKESIKCHHNNLANYIINNFMKQESENIVRYCFHYYNFAVSFNTNRNISKNIVTFCNALLYDYYQIVDYLMNQCYININKCLPIHV